MRADKSDHNEPIRDPNRDLIGRTVWSLGWLGFHVGQGIVRVLRRLLGPRRARKLRVPRWFPLVGNIDGRALVRPARLTFAGEKTTSGPVVKIVVDGEKGKTIPPALDMVASRLFKGHKKFEFNVCFSCVRNGYADPTSIWFNVFLGYYQINVPFAGEAGLPFGYLAAPRADGRASFSVATDTIAAIGEADWNYFSNFFYGVPQEQAARHDKVDGRATFLGRVKIGEREWDHLAVVGAGVVSAYAVRARALELSPSSFKRGMCRAAFGGRRPHAAFTQGFLPARIDATLFMAHDTDLEHRLHRTFIFGATIDSTYPDRAVTLAGALPGQDLDALRVGKARENAEFLRAQEDEIRTVIASEFPHLGFAAS